MDKKENYNPEYVLTNIFGLEKECSGDSPESIIDVYILKPKNFFVYDSQTNRFCIPQIEGNFQVIRNGKERTITKEGMFMVLMVRIVKETKELFLDFSYHLEYKKKQYDIKSFNTNDELKCFLEKWLIDTGVDIFIKQFPDSFVNLMYFFKTELFDKIHINLFENHLPKLNTIQLEYLKNHFIGVEDYEKCGEINKISQK